MTVTSQPTATKSHSESPLMTSLFLTIRSVTSVHYWAEKSLALFKHTILSKKKLGFQEREKKKKSPLTVPRWSFLAWCLDAKGQTVSPGYAPYCSTQDRHNWPSGSYKQSRSWKSAVGIEGVVNDEAKFSKQMAEKKEGTCSISWKI